jgi:Ca-activated chloride channel homolog
MMRLGIMYFLWHLLLPNAGNAALMPMPQNPDDAAIKTEVALVPVDVAVRKKDGTFVDNLQAKDFVVYDNNIAQQIEIFAHEEMPLDVAMIVDCSGSAQPYVLEIQKSAMTVLQQLNPKNDRVALFCIGGSPMQLTGGSPVQLTGLTRDRFLLARTLGNIPKIDGTNIKDVLWQAAEYLRSKGPHHRRAIAMISDNCESDRSKYSNQETLDKMLEAGAILYSIRTSGINTESAKFGARVAGFEALMGTMPDWMQENTRNAGTRVDANPKEIALLARETGGEVLNAQTASDFPKVLNAAILSLKRSYTLGFYPSDKGTDGSYHALKVRLNSRADCSVRARKGYYVTISAASKTNRQVQAPDGAYRSPNQETLETRRNQGSSMSDFLGRYLRYIDTIEKKDPLDGRSDRSSLKNIDFTAVAKYDSNPKGSRTAKIDLQIDLTQLFFNFIDDRYKGDVFVGIWRNHEPAGDVRHYPFNYTEEGFERAMQSKISLSIALPSSKNGDVRIIVFQPFYYGKPPWANEETTPYRQMPFLSTIFYGVQTVRIQF